MKIYFEPTFENLKVEDQKTLYDNRFMALYGPIYMFEFIDCYRAIAVVNNDICTIYLNDNNKITRQHGEDYSYDNYSNSDLIHIVDAYIEDGVIIKNILGEQKVIVLKRNIK